MLEIIIEATRARTAPNFLLQDIPGTTGRLDVIVRCLITLTSLPKRISENIIFTTILNGLPDPPKMFKFIIKYLQPIKNEISGALLFKKIIEKSMRLRTENEIMNGIFFQRINMINYLQSKLDMDECILFLSENGAPINRFIDDLTKINNLTNFNLIIGDQSGFSNITFNFLQKFSTGIKLRGNKSYLSSQCILFIIIELLKINFF
ncbi:MAG: hypothetical protein ACTSPY_15345 [Candidatus Helarchaeota archaeon]